MQQVTVAIALVIFFACSAEATGRMLVSALLVELMADGTTVLSLPMRLPRPNWPHMFFSNPTTSVFPSMHILMHELSRFANV